MKRFPLDRSPMDYQLTIHYNNYASHYGSGAFEKHLRLVYNNLSCSPWVCKEYAAMYNFIIHYGFNKINNFLAEVINYGNNSKLA